MGNPETIRELFSDRKMVKLGWGEGVVAIRIPVDYGGGYAGNGEYKVSLGDVFPLRGIDKITGEGWSIGYTNARIDQNGYL
ncbi:hypothetical protein HYU95_01265 [Candidatus Daviesbacteria bacterium]|nr:hypothetical protein [Candidatus Daviesbacteria bacterium]